MNRILMLLVAVAGFAITSPAIADDGAADAAKKAIDDALAAKADVPAKPPTLPSQASERATFVHENVAFGKKGEAMRSARSEAEKQGQVDADDAHADAANHAAQGAAASAAGAANADAHAAAGQSRADEARTTHSKPPTPTPHAH
jgi:hypothetical protein